MMIKGTDEIGGRSGVSPRASAKQMIRHAAPLNSNLVIDEAVI
jgi:hypothetical protein